MTAHPWSSQLPAGPAVSVLFDTAGFLRTLPLTGAAARTARLNQWLHHHGAATTLLLCDLNPHSRPSESWPLPVRYLLYESLYERPERLRRHLAELAPQVLVMSNTQLTVGCGRELADAAGAVLVYEMHDDEAALLRALGADGHADAAVVQAAAMQTADGVIAFTDRDAARAQALGAHAVHVVPCGVDPGSPPAPRPGAETTVVFVGNLYYEPNRRAVQYLADVLAPALGPGVGIEVIGRYPPALRGLADRLRLRGPVRHLRPVLQTATLAVAPLDAGAGMKLKVLDYLAAGLPVVGTPEAFVGIAEPERWAVTTTLDELPHRVAALLHDELQRRRLGTYGRRLVQQRYSWSTQARRARAAYRAILEQRPTHRRGPAPDPAARALAEAAPYWLREWRSRTTPTTTHDLQGPGMSDDTTGHDGILGEVAEDIDCARLAAEARLDTAFSENAIVGYAQRSMVFLGAEAVLKVYTHRWRERATREAHGLAVAAHANDLRIPEVLARDELPGQLSWLACTRLPGTPPEQDASTTPLLGQVAARLHALPAHRIATLPEQRRRLRDLPDGDSPAHRAARQLDAAVGETGATAWPQCTRGFVHGDLSSRNILLAPAHQPGVLDFEGSGAGCVAEDLAALVLHESLLGSRDRGLLLDSYRAERQRLDPAAPAVTPQHLTFHLILRTRWIMQWSIDLDPDLAEDITSLTPWLLAALTGNASVL